MNDHDLSEEVEERFQVLENKAVYQDRTVDELNGVVTQQQDQIDELAREIRRLRTMLAELHNGSVEAGEEPPPPHY